MDRRTQRRRQPPVQPDVAARNYGQYCGVTTAAELIGERWALLIVRDLLVGPRRYTDLKQGLPRIPTNILSTRLKELQEGGVVRRVPLLNCGLVYELTPYGKTLEPIVLALGRWGFHAMGDPGPDDTITADSLTMALRTAFQADAAVDAAYELQVGDVALHVRVRDGALTVTRLVPPIHPDGGRAAEGESDAVIIAGAAGFHRLLGGEITPAQAIEQEAVFLERGAATMLEMFARAFYIAPVIPSQRT